MNLTRRLEQLAQALQPENRVSVCWCEAGQLCTCGALQPGAVVVEWDDNTLEDSEYEQPENAP